MKKLLYTFLILLAAQNMLQAQYLLEHKLSIEAGLNYNLGFGPETVTVDGVTLPGLVGNMSGNTGYIISAKYRAKKTIGAALSIASTGFSGWTSPNSSDLFEGASFSQVSIRPGMMLSTPYTPTGKYNRLTWSAVVGPAIGLADVSFGESLSLPGYEGVAEVSSSGSHIGLFADFSASYAVSRTVNIHADMGYSQYWQGPDGLYEKSYGLLYAGAGIGFRFMVDKNFLYE